MTWYGSTGEGVTVAVIDTGVEKTPMELQGQVLDRKDFAPHKPGDEHTDYEGHGTGIAGLIAGTGAGQGGDGAFGLAPGSKILPLRIPFDSLGSKFDKPLVEAIRYAADSDAKVINISIGGPADIAGADAVVEYALPKGKLIFASAGNEGEHGSPVE
ncbi:S8 family serine peptidase [Streptomyces sp. B-S-A12]|uniref:S8 family serine peptidase n=1 Tax=Streptomyces luteolus TaxID=3043615 RepID=A0ABT6SQS4_9ACTN|nr:S8 family serine peptidase [Streptomyces sp. B-S-A12]MDI3417951.1 S8 family serine peptidase [Streptomyces sp. B-S-A12]